MAYKKTFNPDALPAHAEPEQAAQALAQLSFTPKPLNNARPNPTAQNNQPRPNQPESQRPQQYGPQQYGPQSSQTYQAQYNQRPPPQQNYNNYKASSPPTSGYGWAPRPPVQQQPPPNVQQQWAPSNNYPPRTPAPPDPDSAELYPVFRAANASRTGSLNSSELGNALVNSDYTPFDPRTINSLMKMFSRSPKGQPGGPTMTYNEFQNLFRFLAEWRQLFERFDEDHSGRISQDEFAKALDAFGYRLTTSFVSTIYNAYNGSNAERRGSRGSATGQGMTFDLFVQACITLKHMTDVFKGYDEDRDGYVTLSFEDFLTEMLRMLG